MRIKEILFLGAAIQNEGLPMFRIRHTLLTGLVLSGFTSLAYAQCGEPSHDGPCGPRILPSGAGERMIFLSVAGWEKSAAGTAPSGST